MSLHVNETDTRVTKDSPYYDIIQEAYSAFHSAIPRDLEVCNQCCMEDAAQAKMRTFQARDIPLSFINEWFGAAVAVPLSQSVWVYLLPRVLEILALGHEPDFCGIEVSLNRFPTGKAENWTARQRKVLDAFQRLYLKVWPLSSTTGSTLDDKVCMFALAGWDVADLMEQILESPEQELVEVLYQDWCTSRHSNQIWVTPFWQDVMTDDEAVKLWTSAELYTRIFDYGMDSETKKTMSDKALELAELILMYPRDWD